MRFIHERYKASLLKHSFGDKKSMRYAVVIESGPENFSAYVPDLPGCIATGKTLDEVLANIRGATEFHLEQDTRWDPRHGMEETERSLV
jgi:predicted RNase H-like HicB family nuclease